MVTDIYMGKSNAELAELFNIPKASLNGLKRGAIANNTPLVDVIACYKDKEKKLQKILSIMKRHHNQVFKNITEVRAYLKEEGVSNYYTSGSRDVLETVTLYTYGKQQGYDWLFKNLKDITYNNVKYRTLKQFYDKNRIIKDDLLTALLENNGDLDKAVDKCKNSENFRKMAPVVLQGVNYRSVEEAARALDFNTAYFRKQIRKGCSPNEALHRALKNKDYKLNVSKLFPATVGGNPYTTVQELTQYLGVSVRTLRVLLLGGLTLEEIHTKYKIEAAKPLITYRGKAYYNTKELADNYKLSVPELYVKTSEFESLEEALDKLEREAINFKGEVFYSSVQFNRVFNLTPRYMSVRWRTVQSLPKDAREEYLEDVLKQGKKRKRILADYNKTDSNMKTLAESLDLCLQTVLNIEKKADNAKEFRQMLKELQDKRKKKQNK